MKNNIMKIKQGVFAVIGFVTLAGFGTAFGDAHTINNTTPHWVVVTINYAACSNSEFGIQPQNSSVDKNECFVKAVRATIYPHWNEYKSFIDKLFGNINKDGAISARPYIFGGNWQNEAEKRAAMGAGTGAVSGGFAGIYEGPPGMAVGTVVGAATGAASGAIGGAISGSGLAGSHTWNVTGSDDTGYQVDLIE